MDETIALGVVMLLVLLVGVGIGMAAGSYVEASKRRSGGSQTEPRCTCRWPLVLALPEDMTCLVHRHMRAKE